MRLDKDVQRLIDTHGYLVAFTRPRSGAAYDAATGTMSGGSSLVWSGLGVFVNYVDADIDGTSITFDDRKLLLQAVDLDRAPEVSDIVDGTLQIVNVRKIQSGETVVAYVCQVRG